MSFGAPGWSFVEMCTDDHHPTLTNEFVSAPRERSAYHPHDNAFDRGQAGSFVQDALPNADPLGLIQNWNYGGVPNAPDHRFPGYSLLQLQSHYDITDSMAKVRGAHTFKGGLYLHKSNKDQTAFTSVNGTIPV